MIGRSSSESAENTEVTQIDRTGPEAVRRGPWSPEEDNKLMEIISLYGPSNWVRVSLSIRTRSPKQCRERYHQNLKPSLNRNPITYEEGILIEQLVAKYGKKWAEIARHLSGRSDNAIKNWWNGGANRRRRASHVQLPQQQQQQQLPQHQLPQQQHQQQQQQQQQMHSVPQMPMFPVPPHMNSETTPIMPFTHASYSFPPAYASQHQHHQPPPPPPPPPHVWAPELAPLAWAPRTEQAPMRLPSLPSLPSLPAVAFNTAMFAEQAPAHSAPPNFASETEAAPRLRQGSAGQISTSPALYHTGGSAPFSYSDSNIMRPNGSWGSASSGTSSVNGMSVGNGSHNYAYGARPATHPSISRSSTSSSTQTMPSRRASLAYDTANGSGSLLAPSNSAGPVFGESAKASANVNANANTNANANAQAQEDHFVVPPFRSLVRGINSPPNAAAVHAGQAESIRVSSLIN